MALPPIEDLEPNVFQQELIEAGLSCKLVVATTAVRTGKSVALASLCHYQAILNPGCVGIFIAQSFRWFEQTMHVIFKTLIGHIAVWSQQRRTWTWPNGAILRVISYEKIHTIEGITASWGIIDEHQDIGYDAYERLLDRVSDERAQLPHIVITGLPVWGAWADFIGKRDSAHYIENVSVDVNLHNLMRGYKETLLQGHTPEEFKRRAMGIKPMPKGRVYGDWVPERYRPQAPKQGGNIILHRYDPYYPLEVGLDWGYNHPAVVFNQVLPSIDSRVFVQDMSPKQITTEALAHEFLKVAVPRSQWRPGDQRMAVDALYCDPRGGSIQSAKGITDIQVFREVTGISPQFTFDSVKTNIEWGTQRCQADVLNAKGERHQLMAQELWDRTVNIEPKARSLAATIVRLKFPKNRSGVITSDGPHKDNVNDHHADAWRYARINRDSNPEIQVGRFR